MTQRFHGVLAVATMLLATAAGADTLHEAGPTAAMESPGEVVAQFAAGAGAGTISLQIQGFATLDGDNFYIDVFHLWVNQTEVFSGAWDLGGGGADRVLWDPNGASVSHVGQQVDLLVPVSFAGGLNTVRFVYDSPLTFEGTDRAGPQGLGDEGWGLNAVLISGAPVPEPSVAALLLAGLLATGPAVCRRRRQFTSASRRG